MTTTHPQWSPVDSDTATLLDLLATDWRPFAERDRNTIAGIIRADALAHGGHVSSNRVRAALAALPELERPAPQRVGATYRALACLGVLRADGFEVSDDLGSRNRGRPCRTYTFTEETS